MIRRTRGICWCVLALIIGGSRMLPAQTEGTSDAERLERLERAVQLLQQRNAELEKEVSSLKAAKPPKTKTSSAPATTAPAAPAANDGKGVAEKNVVKEEKKAV